MTWLDEVRRRLDAHASEDLPENVPGRKAAVLVPMFVKNGALHLLLTLRSEEVEHHKGQISFPGGMNEDDDADLCATSLREAEEEVGLEPKAAIILGRLSEMLTVTGFRVTPYVAAVPHPYEWKIAPAEIVETIDVPLGLLLDPSRREERQIEWQGIPRKVLYYHVGPRPIWGATARMIEELLDVMSAPEAVD